MRPNLSQFTLLLVLLAIPIVQFAVHRQVTVAVGEPKPVATHPRASDPKPAPPRGRLPDPIPDSRWAASAVEVADLIRELGQAGRIHEAMDVTRYALALPRHPTLNNPWGRGHATLALDRMLEIFEAYELWDEAIEFCTAPHAVNIGMARTESRRLRLLGIAFANRRQLTFRSRILTRKLQDTREQLDWREGVDEHHNDICQPDEIVEIDYEENEAARQHIRHSVDIIETHRLSLKGSFAESLAAIQNSDLNLLQFARLHAKANDYDRAVELATRFADSTPYTAAATLAVAELLTESGKDDVAVAAVTEIAETLRHFPARSTLHNRLQSIAPELCESPENDPTSLRELEKRTADFSQEFPNRVTAPTFSLPGVNELVHSLRDYRGQPVLVVFYLGDGCLHCARQLKNLAPLTQEFERQGIPILGISTDDTTVLTESLANYRGRIPFPLAADPQLSVFSAYQLVPERLSEEPLHGTFLIDRDGNVVWQDRGEEPFMDIDFLLEEALRLIHNKPRTGIPEESD